ncbi:transporter, major facilitator family protein [Brevibacterium mcbrellneri ATCC 49030]|uniref:Transporter, major facilitator family protein n=1 Tax=Brevibacterium mcbrellneri ATCC 49030 TaxID=585530 RepID=D4YM90_9MICO|nr:MFS transporter [Brevibacterium mcbrellneri]EFG47684.1 transporter, major facilitator family protein [Brevibacterium mcbrellneri ATCC 49030]
MLSTYRDILSLPGAWRFSFAGLIARFPMAILGLGIVLFVQGVTGSYGLAGILSAVYMVAQAIGNPILAKLVDKHGQSKVMVPVTYVHIAATVVLVVAVYADLWWLVYPATVLTGATVGSVGSLVRARWSYVSPTPRHFSTALSWESVADEFLFIVGPVFVTVLATAVQPAVGIIASSVLLAVGATLYYSQKGTEPPIIERDPTAPKGKVMSNPAIFVVVLSQLFVGINFGALDVGVVAFAEEQGMKSLAGVALGVHAIGSLSAGIVYGAITWKSRARVRFALALSALALGGWAFQLASSLVVLCVIVFFVGLTVAPSIIAASTIIEQFAPLARLTEAFAWIGTLMSVGVAVGSVLAGIAIDSYGAKAALAIPAMGSSVAALVVIVCNRMLDTGYKRHQREVVETGE